MPELPEKPTITKSHSQKLEFRLGNNLPLVHSISQLALEKMGFIKFGTETKGQSIITTYKRGDQEVRYNGVNWTYNGQWIQFLEDIQ